MEIARHYEAASRRRAQARRILHAERVSPRHRSTRHPRPAPRPPLTPLTITARLLERDLAYVGRGPATSRCAASPSTQPFGNVSEGELRQGCAPRSTRTSAHAPTSRLGRSRGSGAMLWYETRPCGSRLSRLAHRGSDDEHEVLGERFFSTAHRGVGQHSSRHHEDEIAQAEGALAPPWSGTWVHGSTCSRRREDGEVRAQHAGDTRDRGSASTPLAFRYQCCSRIPRGACTSASPRLRSGRGLDTCSSEPRPSSRQATGHAADAAVPTARVGEASAASRASAGTRCSAAHADDPPSGALALVAGLRSPTPISPPRCDRFRARGGSVWVWI